MKKYILALFILIGLCQPVWAKTIPVQAEQDFSTESPIEYLSVTILDDVLLDETTTIKAGSSVKGRIIDVTDPKRLKRNATFSFVPLTYVDETGKEAPIKGYYVGKYTTKLNKGDIAKTAALSVGNYFVKGLSMGYSAVEGAVKNEKGNRFKSSVNAVYEDSPFSYVEKGGEIVIKKDQIFLLNFKLKDEPEDEDLPNYEYKELDSAN